VLHAATRLTGNTERKKICKNSPSAHRRTTLSGYISQLRHRQSEKNLLNSNISSKCPHNIVNFDTLAAGIGWRVWGTPANFNGFRVLASLLHRLRSTEVNQILHNIWPSPALVSLIMAALCNRANHYIFVLSFLSSSFFLLIFRCLILAVADWMSTILLQYTWCAPSANLECRSEMCCTRLAGKWKCRTQKNRQKFVIWLSHNFVGLYLRN